jgi:hypothetical protein
MILALIGILLEFIVSYSIMGRSLLSLLVIEDKFNGLGPITIGIVVTTLTAVWFDFQSRSEKFFLRGMLFPFIIFISGVFSGALANYYFNGSPQTFFDWFIKPIYWLCLIGSPLSIILGMIIFFIRSNLFL